jgi:O-antigen/teichoic acid export membrane protein
MGNISLGRVTTLLLLGRGGGYVLSLLNAVILARTLGVDRLGTYAYAMGLAGVFGLLPNLGISTMITRAIARNPEAGTGVLATALRAQGLLAGGILIVIPAFAAGLPEQPVPLWYVALAAGQLAIGTLSWPYLAVLAGRARYDRVAVAELVAGLAGTATLVGAAALQGGVAGFLWGHVLAAGFAVMGARWIAMPLLPTGSEKKIPLRALFREAAPFGATAAVQSVYTRLDIVMLGQMAPAAALGLYSAAYKPINLAVYFGSTVAGTLFPLMAQGTQPEVPVAFVRAMRGLGAAAPALALTMSGLAAPMLRLLFGTEYLAAAPILTVLAWSAAANWLYAPLGVALQARGQERWWLASLIVALVLNAAGNLWAIPRWGALGAAAATLVSEAVLLGTGIGLLWERLALLPQGRPILTGLVASLAGTLSLLALGGSGAAAATATALVVYGALLFFFGSITREDVLLLMAWIREATLGSFRRSMDGSGTRAESGRQSPGALH